MSPEQMLGREVEERTDIFSLGVILFEMSTGHRPYTGTDPVELLVKLSRRAPRADAEDPRVPSRLADIIAKSLEIEVDRRFQSAAELAEALQTLEQDAGTESTTRHGRVVGAHAPTQRRGIVAAAVAVLCAPLIVFLLGLANTSAFNLTFGRVPPFNAEPLQAYLIWGLRSIVAPVFWIGVMTAFWWVFVFTVRLLSLSRRVDHALETGRERVERVTSRLSLSDPRVLAQGIVAFGVLGLALTIFMFADLLGACASFISTAPLDDLAPLRPDNHPEARHYRLAMDALILVLTIGLWRVIRLRAAMRTRQGIGSLSAAVVLLVLTILMNELPYRIVWGSDFKRIDVAGTRCYVIGESGEDWLAYCPETTPPRNRVVKRNDPAVRDLGVIESVFTPPDRSGT